MGTRPDTYYMVDRNVAVTYRHNDNWIFRGEAHFMKGSVHLSPVDNPNNRPISSRDTVLMGSVTYHF